MRMTCSLLPQNNGKLPVSFFGGDYPIVLQDNTYELMYMYINWFTMNLFFNDRICYTKTGGNKNYPYSLNIMVNYHYHGKNWVITR